MNKRDAKRFQFLLLKFYDFGLTLDEMYEYGYLSTGNPNFPSTPETYLSY